ncbi:BatD family protein [Mesorhizobium xinjiangense]|uniref:BatD family protein n=1 Tax=Mesorhizobium xinjiangense TaxID=2678685 RepID=UPI0018DC2A37|nr:BatD family protein [Mesorhizobium xinjiangense]
MRTFLLLVTVFVLSAGVVRAQDPDQPAAQPPAQPIVETELDTSEVVPGQYATLRVTVLVPTWLPKPVEFPSMEAPNLRVRLPERSTGPTSRTVDGEAWSGVSRRYLISPMVADTFDIPAQTISVTYAVPGSSDPTQVDLQTEPVTITGVVPQGAEDLDPFIAAESLKLTQDVTQPTTGLKPGQSIKRTVTVQMEGASPIVLPALMPALEIDGIAAYPDQPAISEKDERGVLSGTRTETETLMAEGGGSGHAPGIELRWFNLKSGAVETASVDGFDISVDGPPAVREGDDRSRLVLAVAGLAALVVLALFAMAIRRYGPRLSAARRNSQERRRASKAWAERELLKAVRRRDYHATLRALDEWARRSPVTDPSQIIPVQQALTTIGRSIYGRGQDSPASANWSAVAEAVGKATAAHSKSAGIGLPPLNPETARN